MKRVAKKDSEKTVTQVYLKRLKKWIDKKKNRYTEPDSITQQAVVLLYNKFGIPSLVDGWENCKTNFRIPYKKRVLKIIQRYFFLIFQRKHIL